MVTFRDLGLHVLKGVSSSGVYSRSASSPPRQSPTLTVSQREVEVLRLLAQGKSNQQIADALVISLNTVLRHVSNIYAKIGAANRADAVAYAVRRNLAG
jgi:DNA-binding NarL/FixJ family response regulator